MAEFIREELEKIWKFIANYRKGEPCDECGFLIPEDGQLSVVTVKGRLLYVVCDQCHGGPLPNVRKQASRLISKKAGKFIPELLEFLDPKKKVTVN